MNNSPYDPKVQRSLPTEDRNTFLRDRPGTKDETVQVVPGFTKRSKMWDRNTVVAGPEEDVDWEVGMDANQKAEHR